MSARIEWQRAKDGFTFLDCEDEALDGMTPDSSEATEGNIGLAIGAIVIYGPPAEVLEMLAEGITKVSEHLAGQ